MSIQFAGSKSQDDRRRRRLVVNADDPADDSVSEGTSGSGVASELVASSAAAPWVPVYEWRIWTYAALIGLLVSGAAFALTRPHAFRPELAPLTQHLLQGDRPVLAVLIQTIFCGLAAQLAMLIGWYRAQCKLDFRGHYRVWTWASIVFSITALCSATGTHLLLGQIINQAGLLPWHGETVSWMLPASVAALLLVMRLDRDVRRSRCSLYTLRIGWLLGVAAACLELYASELQAYPWAGPARVILPMFVSATVFLGLWLHARVVAYVCPDPPDPEERTAWSQLLSAWTWVASRFVWRRKAAEPATDEVKPKRSRKKASTEEEEEESAPKRKRRAPAKRTTKPRTRKVAEVEEEEVEEEQEASYTDESSDSDADNYTESESNEWEEQETEPEPTPPPRGRDSNSSRSQSNQPQYESATPQYSGSKKQNSDWEESEQDSSESDENEDSEDAILRRDTGMTAEQMKGLSKRQKRELRKQSRDQQRNQRR